MAKLKKLKNYGSYSFNLGMKRIQLYVVIYNYNLFLLHNSIEIQSSKNKK